VQLRPRADGTVRTRTPLHITPRFPYGVKQDCGFRLEFLLGD